MTFPTRFTVEHLPYSGQQTNAKGVRVDTWGDPVPRAVYGWQPDTATDGADDRTIADLLLLAPEFPVQPRDRFRIPGEGTLQVPEARRNYNTGPFGYTPGIAVPLRRVDG